MSDKYASFSDLLASESDSSYRIEIRSRGSSVALVAPHAGKIEPGTSEICRCVAGNDFTYYLFEGCKPSKNRELHITSSQFDEPHGIEVVQSAKLVVAFHGQVGAEHFVNVGGRAAGLCASTIKLLKSAGFSASQQGNSSLQGLDPNNICNRGSSGQGLQLEISRGLRDALVADEDRMARFSSTVRLALHGL